MIEIVVASIVDTLREESTINTKPLDDGNMESSLAGSSSIVSYNSDELDVFKRPRVGFQEECNTIYTRTELSKEEADDMWYSRDEIIGFYENCQRIARTVQKAAELSQDDHFWTHRLFKDYQAFCIENDAELEYSILGAPLAFHSASLHGMGIWATPGVDADIMHRVQAQREQIFLLQQKATAAPPELRANMIRRASCTWSRPARLLARHLAQAAACFP